MNHPVPIWQRLTAAARRTPPVPPVTVPPPGFARQILDRWRAESVAPRGQTGYREPTCPWLPAWFRRPALAVLAGLAGIALLWFGLNPGQGPSTNLPGPGGAVSGRITDLDPDEWRSLALLVAEPPVHPMNPQQAAWLAVLNEWPNGPLP